MRKTTLLAAACGIAALWAPAAFARECQADLTVSTTIICNDPALHAADGVVAAALTETQSLLTPAEATAMGDNESVWFDQRDMNCSEDMDGMPMDEADRKSCLAGELEARRLYLLGMPIEGPGTDGRIVPFVRQGADMSWVWAFRFAAPKTAGETLFNRLVEADLKDIHLAVNDSDYTDSFAMRLDYASPRLISANVMGAYLGTQYAHPMTFDHQINVDLETGKQLGFDDAFAPDALPALQDMCLGQLADTMIPDDEQAEDDYRGVRPMDVKLAVADLNRWSFGADAATIAFDPEDEDPNWTCRFAYADIGTLVKPGFPLPTSR